MMMVMMTVTVMMAKMNENIKTTLLHRHMGELIEAINI